MECRRCHFENVPGVVRCFCCGAALVVEETISVVPPRSRWSSRARGVWYTLRRILYREIPVRFPGLLGRGCRAIAAEGALWAGSVSELGAALLASIIPGLGHRRLGQRFRARLLFWSWVTLLLLGVLCVSPWLLAFAVSVHVFCVVDIFFAHRPAGVAQRFVLSLLLFAAFFLLIYRPAGRVLGMVVFARWVPAPAVLPSRSPDESLLVVFTPLGRPQSGDLVLYRVEEQYLVFPPVSGTYPVTVEVRSGYHVGQVLAVAGDEIRFEEDHLLLNGTPLSVLYPPPFLEGTGQVGLLPGKSLVVSEGYVFILPAEFDGYFHGPLPAAEHLLRLLFLVQESEIQAEGFLVLRPLNAVGRL